MSARLVALCAVLIIVALWAAGVFDHALAGSGLNSHDCGRNGFGATFCGRELDEYKTNVEQPARDAQRELEQAFDDLDNGGY